MIFFISDLHFGHRNICAYRTQFKDPQEHDEYIISRWNKKVKKDKYIVWVLGDMCIKNKFYDFPSMIKRLKGTINLISGNHCDLNAYKDTKINIMPGLYKKYDYWLSHAPIHPLELRGKKNVHGHLHYSSLEDNRYINVCCEVIDYSPIALEEIRAKHY